MQVLRLALLFATASATPSVHRLGPYTVSVGDADRLLVVSYGENEVLASPASSHPFLAAAHGPWDTATRQGNVNFTDAIVARIPIHRMRGPGSGS